MKQTRYQVPPGGSIPTLVEYDDGVPEAPGAGGGDAPAHESTVHDESHGGGPSTTNEQPHGDGKEPDASG